MTNIYLNNFIYFLMFICSIFMFCYFNNNILLLLLSLEFVMLSLLMLLASMLLSSLNLMILLMYLVFVVRESVLGKMLLIIFIRSMGNNNLNKLNLIWW